MLRTKIQSKNSKALSYEAKSDKTQNLKHSMLITTVQVHF
jgi:hypothetical protein